MPANLPPDYHTAEQRFREAKTTADKIAALEEMLRIMPKHKGTDRLQGDIKARIAKLRKQPAAKGARRSFSYTVRREGAGQVALVGPANTGKSSLVGLLTKARPEVADYPFTTREPVPGMMPFENIAIQLVDLPPLSAEFVEPWLYDVIRHGDLLWIVLDGRLPLEQFQETDRLLREGRITIYPPGSYRPPDEPPPARSMRALLVITGLDREGVPDNVTVLDEILERRWPIVAVSPPKGSGLEDLRRKTFEALEILRVYTKQPGKPPDLDRPFTLARGSTVSDLAAQIHKDLLANFRFARVWGQGVFDGQTVQREHVLAEGNVVEIHA